MESGSASEKRAKPVSKRESFRHFVVRNQNDLHWLFTAAFLTMLGNWFIATHGYFEFEEHNMRAMVSLLNALAPTFAIAACIFRTKIERHAIAATAIFTLLAILFQAHIATITCFILLICFWIPKNSPIGYVLLGILQLLAFLPIIKQLSPVYTTLDEIVVDSRQYTLYQDEQEFLFLGLTNSYCISETTHVPIGLRLVHPIYSLFDEYHERKRFKLRMAFEHKNCIYLVTESKDGLYERILINLSDVRNEVLEGAHFDLAPYARLSK